MAHKYLTQAQAYADALTAMRRELHMHPEPMHHEVETNRRIRAFLDQHGIAYEAPADNITVALLPGAKPGRTAGVRCDTDALEVTEVSEETFCSKRPGIMHACGHDAQTAMGMFAARILHEHREERAGTVKLIFQPAEEGGKGALKVIGTGVADDIEAFFALHVWPTLPVGQMLISAGPVCASTDRFTITVTGAVGHGAYPDRSADALAAGASIVAQLQHVVARFVPAMEPCVVSVCSFHAGNRWNVIPGLAELEGTVRTFSNAVREQVLARIREVAEHVAQAHRCSAELTVFPICGPIINGAGMAELARTSAAEVFGPDGVQPQTASMIGDDFAEFSAIAPCCYAFLGIASPDGTLGQHPLHHQQFSLDEHALPLGAAWLAETADRFASGRE